MRVAYPMRVDALDKPGGDVQHMRSYIRSCEQIARERGLTFEGRILCELNPDLSSFDLVHLTNLDRPVDLYAQYLAAQRVGKPIVCTPLHHSYGEIERYECKGRGGLIGLVSSVVGFRSLEAVRILVKSRQYPGLRSALWRSLRRGLRSSQAEVLQGCEYVLVITEKEARDIATEVAVLPANRIVLLRNGFEALDRPALPYSERDIDIAVIARVESRKNQVAILDALELLGLKATFVGPPNPNHKKYCAEFRRRVAGSESSYIPGVSPEDVAAILARSRVHVSASWFEVASLVDLDAYAQGCHVVASVCGGTKEVLLDDAHYVDPGSTSDIANKIAAALEDARIGKEQSFSQFLQRSPTWEQTGARLFDMYCQLTDGAQTKHD